MPIIALALLLCTLNKLIVMTSTIFVTGVMLMGRPATRLRCGSGFLRVRTKMSIVLLVGMLGQVLLLPLRPHIDLILLGQLAVYAVMAYLVIPRQLRRVQQN